MALHYKYYSERLDLTSPDNEITRAEREIRLLVQMNSHVVSFHHFVVLSDISVILALYPREYKHARLARKKIDKSDFIKIQSNHPRIKI